MRFSLDPHPFWRAGTGPILVVCAMQIVEAGMLLGFPPAVGATPLLAMLISLQVMGLGSVHGLAICLLIGAALAVVGAIFRIGCARLAILMPQNFLLGVMAFGGIVAAAHGRYLDGTTIPGVHIFADQLGMLALLVIHSVAIIDRSRDPDG